MARSTQGASNGAALEVLPRAMRAFFLGEGVPVPMEGRSEPQVKPTWSPPRTARLCGAGGGGAQGTPGR